MNTDQFIEGVRVAVYHAAIRGVLKDLAESAGKPPWRDLPELSRWFEGLPAGDKEKVAGIVRHAAYAAVFTMMAALDGVSAIDDQATELYLRTGDGTALNENHDLHELFQITVDHELGYVDESGNPIT
ncbi:MAG TPA: hypothetical protein VEC76_19965 [Streptosporangiaceae bacterium]|nr:hypothetical protein [Streptosporangiaceae bacterium]